MQDYKSLTTVTICDTLVNRQMCRRGLNNRHDKPGSYRRRRHPVVMSVFLSVYDSVRDNSRISGTAEAKDFNFCLIEG